MDSRVFEDLTKILGKQMLNQDNASLRSIFPVCFLHEDFKISFNMNIERRLYVTDSRVFEHLTKIFIKNNLKSSLRSIFPICFLHEDFKISFNKES